MESRWSSVPNNIFSCLSRNLLQLFSYWLVTSSRCCACNLFSFGGWFGLKKLKDCTIPNNNVSRCFRRFFSLEKLFAHCSENPKLFQARKVIFCAPFSNPAACSFFLPCLIITALALNYSHDCIYHRDFFVLFSTRLGMQHLGSWHWILQRTPSGSFVAHGKHALVSIRSPVSSMFA
jgi:hypothetical protein